MNTTLTIEVFSDVVCPWCYIGKHRLAVAADTLARGADGGTPLTLDIVPRAFQLDPTAPVDAPTPVIDVYTAKFGGIDNARSILARVTETAAADGLTFRLDRALRANTLRAHRLIWWSTTPAAPIDPSDIEERIMAAYFTDGQDIGAIDTLADLAAAAGAERSVVVDLLDGDDGINEVNDDLERAAELSITGVPTILLGGAWGITGAQEPDTLVRLLRRFATADDSALADDQPGQTPPTP